MSETITYDKEGADIREAVEARLAAKHKRAPFPLPKGVVLADSPENIFCEDCEDAPVMKESNPKQAHGDSKLPLDLVPDTAIALASLAFMDGASRYGRHNWRAIGVRASTYLAALKRHMAAWTNGEEDAPDGVPHLAHAIACLMILVDAKAAGKLTDDRPPSIDYPGWAKDLTKWVAVVKERNADHNPRHYTIEDRV